MQVPIRFSLILEYELSADEFLVNKQEIQEQLNADFFRDGINTEIKEAMKIDLESLLRAINPIFIWTRKTKI